MSFAETIIENITTFLSFTGFANATSGHLIMILVGLIFLYQNYFLKLFSN